MNIRWRNAYSQPLTPQFPGSVPPAYQIKTYKTAPWLQYSESAQKIRKSVTKHFYERKLWPNLYLTVRRWLRCRMPSLISPMCERDARNFIDATMRCRRHRRWRNLTRIVLMCPYGPRLCDNHIDKDSWGPFSVCRSRMLGGLINSLSQCGRYRRILSLPYRAEPCRMSTLVSAALLMNETPLNRAFAWSRVGATRDAAVIYLHLLRPREISAL